MALWLPLTLLLLQVPGCFLLSGPSKVTGTVGGSLSVQCRYEEEHETHDKYWCRRSHVLLCDKIVETKGSMRKATSGRVTIRVHPASLSFTVTLESLTLEDEGTYSCGVDKPWLDSTFKVVVSVLPASATATASYLEGIRSTVGPPLFLSMHTWHSSTKQDTSRPSPQPWSLFSSIHFLLLVFLKVPLFLSMLSAVLWVNRPQRGSGWRDTMMRLPTLKTKI
ncbi:CMRF35-like molecule 6 [Fukomys damarensis]|nr:CMRF35-like molecule 6 [Fukomys damarensis]